MNAESQPLIRRARIEEVRPLANEYRDEVARRASPGEQWEPPLPQGGIFWVAEDAEDRHALGYAGGRLSPEGLTIGPIFVRSGVRRSGVGEALLTTIQRWAEDTRVPVVEVSVAVDNEAGRAFLESAGYVPRRVLFSLTPERADRPAGVERD